MYNNRRNGPTRIRRLMYNYLHLLPWPCNFPNWIPNWIPNRPEPDPEQDALGPEQDVLGSEQDALARTIALGAPNRVLWAPEQDALN